MLGPNRIKFTLLLLSLSSRIITYAAVAASSYIAAMCDIIGYRTAELRNKMDDIRFGLNFATSVEVSQLVKLALLKSGPLLGRVMQKFEKLLRPFN